MKRRAHRQRVEDRKAAHRRIQRRERTLEDRGIPHGHDYGPYFPEPEPEPDLGVRPREA